MAESILSKKIQNLRSFTVQIRHVQTQAIAGTGFVVSSDGLIATCAHVVVAAGLNPRLGQPIPSHWTLIRERFFPSSDPLKGDRTVAVPVYFPQAKLEEQRRQTAIVVGCFKDSSDDVVLLQATILPEGVDVALVDGIDDSINVADERRFRSYGYRRLGNYQGLQADGEILGTVEPPADRKLLKDPVQLRSPEIDSGMSGAAVLDMVRNKVVGIISETSDIGSRLCRRRGVSHLRGRYSRCLGLDALHRRQPRGSTMRGRLGTPDEQGNGLLLGAAGYCRGSGSVGSRPDVAQKQSLSWVSIGACDQLEESC